MNEIMRAIVLASTSAVVATRRRSYVARPVVRNSKFGNIIFQK